MSTHARQTGRLPAAMRPFCPLARQTQRALQTETVINGRPYDAHNAMRSGADSPAIPADAPDARMAGEIKRRARISLALREAAAVRARLSAVVVASHQAGVEVDPSRIAATGTLPSRGRVLAKTRRSAAVCIERRYVDYRTDFRQ